jgi:predicted regulator of Ras-like GTPase activity (Roadblock/LC7/MglB family)
MESTLAEVNAVLGVNGSFVCLMDGSIAAQAMPEKYSGEPLNLAARVASQTLHALETSGQRVIEADLIYGNGRLVIKNLRGGALVILCARNVNLPLLNLTAKVAVKKLAAELKPAKTPAPKPTAQPAPAPVPVSTAPAITTRVVAPSPRFIELEQEAQRVMAMAKDARVTLCAINPLGMWHCCPNTRALLAPPEKRHIDFAGLAAQNKALVRLFEQAGYQGNQRFNAFHGDRRLYFTDAKRDLSVDVFLGAFEMYHRFDLTTILTQESNECPETALLLTRLQIVEMSGAGLSDICALLLEHDLSVGVEKEKIDASQIARLCANDWGWYKTVTLNLSRAATFAVNTLPSPSQAIVVERLQRLNQSIENMPKSLAWQTRARLGEGVPWYDPPLLPSSAERPDMAIG